MTMMIPGYNSTPTKPPSLLSAPSTLIFITPEGDGIHEDGDGNAALRGVGLAAHADADVNSDQREVAFSRTKE